MKKLLILFFFSIFLASPIKTQASVRSDSTVHGFAAVGALGIPASFRVGGKNFEIGMLTRGVFGTLWNIDLGPKLYSSMGIGINSGGVGIYGGLGAELWKMWILGIRVEAGAFVNIRNDSSGSLLLGANIGF